MNIAHIDHIVLTVRDIDATCEFYQRVLGIMAVTFDENRTALVFGSQKINLHPALDNPVTLVAAKAMPGSSDFCLITEKPLDEVIAHIEGQGVEIIAGPVERPGAQGPIQSIYLRDPDGNLVEVANYL